MAGLQHQQRLRTDRMLAVAQRFASLPQVACAAYLAYAHLPDDQFGLTFSPETRTFIGPDGPADRVVAAPSQAERERVMRAMAQRHLESEVR